LKPTWWDKAALISNWKGGKTLGKKTILEGGVRNKVLQPGDGALHEALPLYLFSDLIQVDQPQLTVA
jgi:hypothetical protein